MAVEISLIDGTPARPRYARKPDWLRVALPVGDEYEQVKAKVNTLALHTVCKEAACPNLAECWGAGTATIMILGDTLHARLPLLQRQDGQSARRGRLARAGARRRSSARPGLEVFRAHRGRPRRPRPTAAR